MSAAHVFYDDGSGTTARTLSFFRDFLRKKPLQTSWKPFNACLEANREPYALMIDGFLKTTTKEYDLDPTEDRKVLRWDPACVLLSGVSCGYGGEGPHGMMAVLSYLVDKNFDHDRIARGYWLNEDPGIREAILGTKHLHFDLRELPQITFTAPPCRHDERPEDDDYPDDGSEVESDDPLP